MKTKIQGCRYRNRIIDDLLASQPVGYRTMQLLFVVKPAIFPAKIRNFCRIESANKPVCRTLPTTWGTYAYGKPNRQAELCKQHGVRMRTNRPKSKGRIRYAILLATTVTKPNQPKVTNNEPNRT